MLRDCYAIPDNDARHDNRALEIHDELTEILQQIDVLLFTDTGDVLGMPGFGCNLESTLFSTTYNESYVANMINEKIKDYIYLQGQYDVTVSVEFVQWSHNVGMVLNITIRDTQSNKSKKIKYMI